MSRLFASFLLLLLTCSASAEKFVGVGQAVLIGDQRSQAEALALDVARSDALRQAIEVYAKRGRADAHTLSLKMGDLLAGNRSFLGAERRLDARFSAPMLTVELEIDIDMQALGKALGLQGVTSGAEQSARQLSRPMMVVVVAEELNGSMNSFPYSAGVIQNRLIAADYELVDNTIASRAAKHDQAVQAVFNNDSASARALALQFEAGVTVTGRAIVQASGLAAGGMSSYGANVALTAVAADSGRVLASASADANYPHVNALTGSRRAVEEAAGVAADQLIAALADAEQSTARPLRLNVDGVNYEQLGILKRILQRDFPEISTVQTRGFSGDIARLDVTLTTPVVEFAEALSSRDFGAFRLRVLSQSAAKIDATVVLR